jgi:hypothetical protein
MPSKARQPWTSGVLAAAVAESKSVDEVAQRLGRTKAAVYSRAHVEGVSLVHFMPRRTISQLEYKRQYYKRNKNIRDAYCRNWRRKTRLELIAKFGGKCANCMIDNPDVLDFDHIENDGYKDPKRNIVFLVKANPERFQLLCKNCNWLKELNRRINAQQVTIAKTSDASCRA